MRSSVMWFYRRFLLILILGLSGCGGSLDPTGTLPVVNDDATSGLDRTSDVASTIPDGSDCTAVGTPSTTTHRAMFDALNLYRIENDLTPLVYSVRLESVIQEHVQDLWARGFFDHTNPDGEGPSDRAIRGGYCHIYVGENIAAGQTNVPNVMDAWKNSPGHDANMKFTGYTYVGVGHFTAPNGRQYWGQLFSYDVPGMN